MRGGSRRAPLVALVLSLFAAQAVGPRPAAAEDGYDLWLRYVTVSDTTLLRQYRAAITRIVVEGDSETLRVVRAELARGLAGLLGATIPTGASGAGDGAVIAGTPASSPTIRSLGWADELARVGRDGFVIRSVRVAGRQATVIAANSDAGVLYGAFRLLRQLQMHAPVRDLVLSESPKVELRMLNHWDNLDRSVERGYAGRSLWDWQKLPEYLSPRYTDYARANASLGINGTVLTNVNANADALTPAYLEKVAALAGVFRPYGIRVYLTARFSAPIEIGGLQTADPMDPGVQAWWKRKVDEIYTYVPDFGGFLVKANSEGQPGPQDYRRTHAQGANMLADALAPHDGIVMWRAFVYSNEQPVDRIRQAYEEFQPLDGEFRDNVLIQVKNGPLDFQPREPFSALFGAMPGTPLMMEFQVTKEYLGMATHLVYLGTMFEEVLEADTWAKGRGSTVARVIDGTLHGYRHTGMAGVANTGTDRNWTGSQFNQANWYAFGRLAWDPDLSAEAIATEWIRQTFSNDESVIAPIRSIMMGSREAAVNYMTPLGLAHQMAEGHHYGPGPWVSGGPRADWTSVYYHRADTLGIGFDRTATGSNAIAQYFPEVRRPLENVETTPDSVLLFFHHVRWDRKLDTGRTVWNELVHRYHAGVDSVRAMQRAWDALEGRVDADRFAETQAFLRIQEREARWWRDASILYFQTFSRMPIPEGYERPEHTLEHYRSIVNRYVTGQAP
jgi:alpha-glucuronidase